MLQITWMCFINFINTTIKSKCIDPKGGKNRIHICSQPTVTGYCLGIQYHLIFRGWTLVFIWGVHHLIPLLTFKEFSPSFLRWEAESASLLWKLQPLQPTLRTRGSFRQPLVPAPELEWEAVRERSRMRVVLPDQPWGFSL